VLLRIATHADTQPWIVLSNERHQFVGIPQPTRDRLKIRLAGRRIAAQGHDVANAALSRESQPVEQLLPRRSHAGEVSRRGDGVAALDLDAQLNGSLAGAAAGTVGTGDEARLITHQAIQSLEQRQITGRRLGGKNLNRQTELAGAVVFANLHQVIAHFDRCDHQPERASVRLVVGCLSKPDASAFRLIRAGGL